MELPTIFIFTHDAMGDGEDGPTHQPVEQLASLRAVPGLVMLRPGDANEVVEAYRYIMQLRHKPAVLVLVAPAVADPGPKQICAGIRGGARRLCPGRCSRQESRSDPHRLRQRSQPRRGGARKAAWPKAFARAWFRCRPGTFSSIRRRSTATACCRPGSRRASRSSRPRRSAGNAMSARGSRHRHENLRGLGAAQGTPKEIRLRAGAIGRSRQKVIDQKSEHS